MMIKSVCVFCGSSMGSKPDYVDGARAMGREIAHRGLTLVYGGGSVGLMGVVADAALDAGGAVHGVIPQALDAKEIGHKRLTHKDVVGSMHERKARMAELSDAFVAMPGGIGTYEEIFEIWTWAQLGIHHKPLGFYNVEGFYDGLLGFLDKATAEGYVREQHRHMALVDDRPGALLDKLKSYVPTAVAKWIDEKQT
jgi:uncharacterized protein (TIGR00730 family)